MTLVNTGAFGDVLTCLTDDLVVFRDEDYPSAQLIAMSCGEFMQAYEAA